MSFVYFVKLMLKNLKWLIMVPLCLAGSIYYFTRHEKKVFASETVIYTGIQSGYSLSGNSKVDYFTANNAFDNLISMINSRETKKEVALRLLAEHLCLPKHDAAILSWESYSQLKDLVPDSLRKKFVRGSVGATYAALDQYMHQSDDNLVYKILFSNGAYYSISALDGIKPMRVNTSDLIRLSYQTNDAAICKHTLEIILEVFMRKHRSLKEGQAESVVAYFEKQTRDAFHRLDSAEEEFLNFNKRNNIINYNEQTKAVADQKERLYTQNHDIEMDKTAANTSLDKVNENIEGRRYQIQYGAEVIREREELSDIYSKIALSETMGNSSGSARPQRQLDSLRRLATARENRLQQSLVNLYEKSNTPNGIPTKEVLNEWLQTMLSYEQSKAKLTVMDRRKKEFDDEYKKYAPLGAMLKKIERKIHVSEQEYLELLHDLSMARLTQQNNELTTKLNVVDSPFLPLTPIPSKRMVLVIVGFLAGFVVVLAVILARALANKTLQQPQRAARAIGLPMLGLYPLKTEQASFISKARLRILQHLLPHIPQTKAPAYVGFVSVQAGEGKTTIMEMVGKELRRLQYNVVMHRWDGTPGPLAAAEADVVLVEYPSLDNLVMKPGSVPELDYCILICRANRIWDKMDKEMLRLFRKATNTSPSFVLNGVVADFSEEFIGEIPKKRTIFRRNLKRLLKFEFGNRRTLGSRAKKKMAAKEFQNEN